jgi:hypothetical protein
MSRWADWFAITHADQNSLLEALEDGDAAVDAWIIRRLERLGGPPLHVALDKLWEPIHRCLTADYQAGGRLDFQAGAFPLNHCVLGGEPLYEGFGRNNRTAALVYSDQVPAVAAALAEIDAAWLRQRFFAIPDRQFHEIDESACRHVCYCIQELLVPLFAEAATRGFAVVCTISH